ncbi:hypothetical protein D1P53_002308 [Cryptococcus gattii VGV]|nr:hypothetical protein D1P53_002308 [Cryptococcus gattii VGV]
MLRRYSSPAGPRDDTRCTARPPLPRFHTTLPNSPALYRHSIVSLPSPSRSSPESPANASEALKDILRQSNSRSRSRSEGVKVTNDGSRDDGDMWKDVERRMRYSNRPLHLQEPLRVRASRSITLPSSYPPISQPQPQPQPQPQNISVTQTTHQSTHDNTPKPIPSPPKKLTFLRSLFPLSTITTAVPTTPFPTPTTPPFTSPLSPSPHERADGNGKEKEKREKFDVDKVYERLRVAEGRVSFDDLGLGLCAEDMDIEGDDGEDGRG